MTWTVANKDLPQLETLVWVWRQDCEIALVVLALKDAKPHWRGILAEWERKDQPVQPQDQWQYVEPPSAPSPECLDGLCPEHGPVKTIRIWRIQAGQRVRTRGCPICKALAVGPGAKMALASMGAQSGSPQA